MFTSSPLPPALLPHPSSGRDFQLTLSGAVTEQELQLKRLQLLEAYERQRLKVGRLAATSSACVGKEREGGKDGEDAGGGGLRAAAPCGRVGGGTRHRCCRACCRLASGAEDRISWLLTLGSHSQAVFFYALLLHPLNQ